MYSETSVPGISRNDRDKMKKKLKRKSSLNFEKLYNNYIQNYYLRGLDACGHFKTTCILISF